MLLDVPLCLAVWSNDSSINMNPKILCPEDMFQADHELQHLQKTVFLLFRPEGERHYCAAVRCSNLFVFKISNYALHRSKLLAFLVCLCQLLYQK
ncbi:hypothetical protein AVEN_38955-1 [Araneus ventricosus]|uniref:Uncharacterized protein n=1 Tax=Araneus ventricosus TaxID=182803 RepID=A0A4Y2PZR3_ARAVE|nr:hypothetical protein AVEN_38955-1 [Araneus ventricosus]